MIQNLFQKIILIKDNEFKTINAEVLSQIAEKWLKAMEENNVEAILPKTKEELSFFEVWWYNFSLVYSYYQGNEYPSFEPQTFVDGYYGEKFDIGSWLLKQNRQEANRKLFKEQIKALDDLNMVWSKNSSNYRTKKSDIVASKQLKAIRNNEIEKILPSSLGRLKNMIFGGITLLLLKNIWKLVITKI